MTSTTPAALAFDATTSAANDSVPPAPSSQTSPRRLNRWDALSAAQRELRWLHSEASLGAEPATVQARQTIQGWLAQIPSFHRGALALHHQRRAVPASLAKYIGESTFALLLRVEVAARPGDGKKTLAELEAEAIARLELAVFLDGADAIAKIARRAHRHVDLAETAYLRVRGRIPSILPA